MPKLLQINSCANWGSTGRIAEQIGEVAMVQGWESYVAYGRDMNPSKSHLIKIGNKFDVLMHGLKSILFDKHGFGSRRATIRFIDEIEQISPDIIHLHNIHGYYINIEVLFNYLSKTNMMKQAAWNTGREKFSYINYYESMDRFLNQCK